MKPTINVWYEIFGKPGPPIDEPNPSGKGTRRTYIFGRDPLFVLLITLPFSLSTLSWIVAIVCFFQENWMQFGTSVMVALILGALGLLFFLFFREIPPAHIAVRTFLGVPVIFQNCRIFSFPGLTMIVLITNTREAVLTAEDQENTTKYKVYSLVPIDPSKQKSIPLFFTISINYQTDITHPQTLIQAFLLEFRQFGLEAVQGMKLTEQSRKDKITGVVEDYVLQLVSSQADECLQQTTVLEIMTHVQQVNTRLTDSLRGPLAEFGIFLIRASIVDTQDDKSNLDKPFAKLLAAGSAEVKSTADQRIFKTQADAYIVETEQSKRRREEGAKNNAAAVKIEEETRIQNAQNQNAAQQEVLKLRETLAQIAQVDLLARLEVLKDRGAAVAISQLQNMTPADVTMVAKQVAEAMASKLETAVGVGQTDLSKLHPLAAIILPLLERYYPTSNP